MPRDNDKNNGRPPRRAGGAGAGGGKGRPGGGSRGGAGARSGAGSRSGERPARSSAPRGDKKFGDKKFGDRSSATRSHTPAARATSPMPASATVSARMANAATRARVSNRDDRPQREERGEGRSFKPRKEFGARSADARGGEKRSFRPREDRGEGRTFKPREDREIARSRRAAVMTVPREKIAASGVPSSRVRTGEIARASIATTVADALRIVRRAAISPVVKTAATTNHGKNRKPRSRDDRGGDRPRFSRDRDDRAPRGERAPRKFDRPRDERGGSEERSRFSARVWTSRARSVVRVPPIAPNGRNIPAAKAARAFAR